MKFPTEWKTHEQHKLHVPKHQSWGFKLIQAWLDGNQTIILHILRVWPAASARSISAHITER